MDRNTCADLSEGLRFSRRSLRGNVDRNIGDRIITVVDVLVVPYVGTWIEIPLIRGSR